MIFYFNYHYKEYYHSAVTIKADILICIESNIKDIFYRSLINHMMILKNTHKHKHQLITNNYKNTHAK